MRYIGSKANILDFLEDTIKTKVGNLEEVVFGDLFAGTASVAKRFKELGSRVIANDYMAFSFSFQVAYLMFYDVPKFKELKPYGLMFYENVIDTLNKIKPTKGFFFNNYTIEGTHKSEFKRNYFSESNAQKIDGIMKQLRNWRTDRKIDEKEEQLLRASLIDAISKVSNISGTYGAFLKEDDSRKYKDIELKKVDIVKGRRNGHKCYNVNILELIKVVKGDVLYLDPPYNQRQYPPYYHILETAALDDNPAIYGKTGRRPYKNKISPFCRKQEAAGAIDEVIKEAKFSHIFLSYNTDGLVSISELKDILEKYGEVDIQYKDYRRYKSNSNGNLNKKLKEVLLYVRKNNKNT